MPTEKLSQVESELSDQHDMIPLSYIACQEKPLCSQNVEIITNLIEYSYASHCLIMLISKRYVNIHVLITLLLSMIIITSIQMDFFILGASLHCIKAPEFRLALICPKSILFKKGQKRDKEDSRHYSNYMVWDRLRHCTWNNKENEGSQV